MLVTTEISGTPLHTTRGHVTSTLTVPNGFSKRYRKSELFLIIHKNVLIVFAVYLTDT